MRFAEGDLLRRSRAHPLDLDMPANACPARAGIHHLLAIEGDPWMRVDPESRSQRLQGEMRGAHLDPVGWSFVSQLVGPTDDGLFSFITDRTTVANLTWYRTGATTSAGPFSVTGFSATSSITGQITGWWSSEDTLVGGGVGDGFTVAAFNTTPVPGNPTPEPASVLLFAAGLIGVALRSSRVRSR